MLNVNVQMSESEIQRMDSVLKLQGGLHIVLAMRPHILLEMQLQLIARYSIAI